MSCSAGLEAVNWWTVLTQLRLLAVGLSKPCICTVLLRDTCIGGKKKKMMNTSGSAGYLRQKRTWEASKVLTKVSSLPGGEGIPRGSFCYYFHCISVHVQTTDTV